MNNNKIIHLSRKSRLLVYIYIIFMTITFFFEQGVIPSSMNEIKQNYSLNDVEYGLVNSSHNIGKIIGSLFFAFLFNCIKRKLLISINISATIISLFIMTYIKDKNVLYICRYISGYAHVFYIVYHPIWCDQYGIKQYKTYLLTLIQFSFKLGFFISQIIANIIGWKNAFLLEGVLGIIYLIIFIFIPDIYFSDKVFSTESEADKDKLTIFKDISISDSNTKKQSSTISSKICSNVKLLLNVTYMMFVLGRAFIYFTLTALSSWQHNYAEEVFEIHSKAERIKYFSMIFSVPSFIGMLLGGIVGNKVSQYGYVVLSFAVLMMNTLSCIGCLCIAFTQSFYAFCVSEFVFILFQTATMPNLTRIIISTVDNVNKPSANSIASFFSNTLGHSPAPYFYGVIKHHYPNLKRLPMQLSCGISLVSEIFFVLGFVCKVITSRFENKDNQYNKLENKANDVEMKNI